MSTFNVREAKTHFSRLLERAAQGEEVLIAKRGRPVARLVPMTAEPRRPGRLKGRIRMGSDFDDPLPDEILGAFRGEGSPESEEQLWFHQPERQARTHRAEGEMASGKGFVVRPGRASSGSSDDPPARPSAETGRRPRGLG